MFANRRPLTALVLIGVAAASLLAGCGASNSSGTNAPAGQSSSEQSVELPAIGPDEASVKEQFLPVLVAEQEATSAALGEMEWLDEPAFSYRQSSTNATVASLNVTGITRASTDEKDAWLARTNEVLVPNGFDAIADYRTDEGNGLLLVSANTPSDACFTARWGQGTVAITIEVGAPDSLCRLG